MGGKFSTTSSSLFNNNSKEQVPDWMSKIADNLEVKDRHIDVEFNKPRGAFAQYQPVYRPEGDASLRALAHQYSDTKLISDAKIQLARFLSGKYYRVKNSFAGSDQVSLEVVIDGVASNFQFPFEVRSGKLTTASTFFGNESDYPFSKAGLEECLTDIKSNKVKTSKKVEAVGKTYLINREEIVRRFNGSLRQATDRINSLLNEGVIVGAGSNTYASFYDADHLFPQMEKEAGEERMAEFHFAPNQEHVAAHEVKSANVLSLDASKILADNFSDFMINQAVRDGNELLVKATVLNAGNNVRSVVDFSFDIVNEKVASVKVAEINDNRMSLSQLHDYLDSGNKLLNQYATNHSVGSSRLTDNFVFAKKDIRNRLNKVINASKVERVMESWAVRGLVTQLNSTTFASNHSFEDLLSKTIVASVLSQEEVDQIKAYEQHFGQGLEFERDEKQILERVREASDAESSDDAKFSNLQHHLTRFFKNFSVSDFNRVADNSYMAALNFVNNGVRNKVNIIADFSNGISVAAVVNGSNLTLDKLAQAFEKSPVLAAYLSDSKGHLVAGKTVMSIESISRKLSEIVASSDVEKTISSWLNNNLIVNIGDNNFVSEHSFEELLQMTNVAALSESELSNRIAHKKRNKMLEVSANFVDDTGSRELINNWSPETMTINASQQIGSMFRDYELTDVELNSDSYTVTARVVNPIDGLKKKLKFTFAMDDNGNPRNLSSVSDDECECEPKDIISLLQSKNEAVKQFTSLNSVANRSYNTVINKSRLESQLKTVASAEHVSTIVDLLIKENVLQPMNSYEFASTKSMSEIVAYLSSKAQTNVEAGQDQMNLAVRNEHRLDLRGQHVQETDSRALDARELELSPQMKAVQAKIAKAVRLAKQASKITSRKSELLLTALDAAKTEKDLDIVSKELKRYLI